MGRIIVTVVLVVVLAILVSMNLGFTTSVNLFGYRFDGVSVVAVAALSFALGVVYSLFIYISRFLHRRASRGLANRDRALSEREKELAAAGEKPDVEEAAADEARSPAGSSPGSPAGSSPGSPAGSPPANRRTGLARLLDFFRL
jgi:hypothetical protein